MLLQSYFFTYDRQLPRLIFEDKQRRKLKDKADDSKPINTVIFFSGNVLKSANLLPGVNLGTGV